MPSKRRPEIGRRSRKALKQRAHRRRLTQPATPVAPAPDSPTTSTEHQAPKCRETPGLEGLNNEQKQRVLKWLGLFSLTKRELTIWKSVREKFIRSTTYTVQVVTPADEVCRNLFELKQFAQRIVSLLPKVTLEVVAKKIQGAFSVQDIAHWRNAIHSIQLPFRFDIGQPQAELNALAGPFIEAESTKTDDLDIRVARVTPSITDPENDTEGEPQLMETLPPVPTISTTDGTTSRMDVTLSVASCSSTAPPKPSNSERLSSAHNVGNTSMHKAPVDSVVTISSIDSKVKVLAVIDSRTKSTSDGRLTKLYRLDDGGVSGANATEATVDFGAAETTRTEAENKPNAEIVPESLVVANSVNVAGKHSVPCSVLPPDTTDDIDLEDDTEQILPEVLDISRKPTDEVTVATSGTKISVNDPPTTINASVDKGQVNASGVSINNNQILSEPVSDDERMPENPLSRTQPFASNPFIATFPMQEYDLPIIEISPILRKYLMQFRVEPVEYIWWLKQRGQSPDSLMRLRDLLAKVDEFIVYVANMLEQMNGLNKVVIPHVAKLYGVQAHSLEKWMHYRKLFEQDKTALKFSLFGESALIKCTTTDRSICQLENINNFKPCSKRRRVSIRAPTTYCDDHEMIERVMSFYMLSPAVLDQLPLAENIEVQRSADFTHMRPVEKLLYDLESVIIKKCEVSQFQEMFPTDVGRVCFGPVLMNRSGRLRALYQLPLGDVLAAATENNSGLKSKPINLPAYFDTAYDGAQPIVPADATCALVNATHTGSTNRDRQKAKTLAKIAQLLKQYGTDNSSAEITPNQMQQDNVGFPQEFVVPVHGEPNISNEMGSSFVHDNIYVRVKEEPLSEVDE